MVDGRRFCGETIARVITEKYPSADFEMICDIHDSIKGLAIEDLYLYITKKMGIKINPQKDMEYFLRRDFEIQRDNADKMVIFDGVVEILEFLKSSGKKVYICTNRKKELLLNMLDANNIAGYFDEVISCADVGYKKPNPYCLVDLAKRSGLDISEFIYFGDSEVDSQFAQNANIDHIIFDQYMNNKNLFKKLVNMFLERQINGEH
ncbi:MAG: HAD family hydrolase [Clostridiales bacterium]|nr:HAD family hydrolase [Clostridiales bacterium]